MKILWFTWKDRQHPLAGGAERVNEEIGARLAKDGHEVVFLVAGFEGAEPEESRDGFKIVRVGARFSVYWRAYRHYKRHFKGWADLVVDEMNTLPFFCRLYVHERSILFSHQLCREIWFYQLPFPVNLLGYLLEPVYLRILNKMPVITVSISTKKDFLRFGFKADRISIISEGTGLAPITALAPAEKFHHPTLLSLGTIRSMKRTAHQVRAFEIAKAAIPSLRFKLAGYAEGAYGKDVLRMISSSPHASDIEYIGRPTEAEKAELMRKSHVILVTSVKEGWGLIVTEAGSQGTPAVVYDVDGLRDSVRDRETGLICKNNTPENLASAVVDLLRAPSTYARLRENAWKWSHELTFEQCHRDFIRAAGLERA